jgi:hypothetical protein
MSARVSLMALLAGLFGLQVPLCAMACTSTAEPVAQSGLELPASSDFRRDSAPDSTPDSAHEMPCHGAPEAPASERSDSHGDCDCETIDSFSVDQAAYSGHRLSAGSELSPPPPAPRLVAAVQPVALAPDRDLRLPAPDILLLKSTLLI